MEMKINLSRSQNRYTLQILTHQLAINRLRLTHDHWKPEQPTAGCEDHARVGCGEVMELEHVAEERGHQGEGATP